MMKSLLLFVLTMFGSHSYAVDILLLGDVHYDSPDVRVEPNPRHKEYERNIKQWESAIPELLQKASIRSQDKIEFAVQLGDFIQGDCGSQKKHALALSQSIQKMTEHLKVPLYLVKGNHDIRGKGGEVVYREVAIPYMNETLGVTNVIPGSAHYAVMYNGDLFIYYDSIKPSVKFLEGALKRHAAVRRVFFFTHLPVLPCSSGKQPDWIIYGQRPNRPDERRRVLSLLAKHHAIVLCGHVHRYSLVRYRSEEGTITQLSVFSMAMHSNADDLTELHYPGDAYFTLPNAVSRAKEKAVQEVMNDFKGKYLEYTVFRPSPDFAVLKIEDDNVSADLYLNNPTEAVKTLKLFPATGAVGSPAFHDEKR